MSICLSGTYQVINGQFGDLAHDTLPNWWFGGVKFNECILSNFKGFLHQCRSVVFSVVVLQHQHWFCSVATVLSVSQHWKV